jgi:hypothetical protein
MAYRITNEMLGQLLMRLGFERGDVTKKNRVWRHPESGCTLLLPDNKMQEAPRPADLVGVKTHLHFQGHLDERDFDRFVAEGELPVSSA